MNYNDRQLFSIPMRTVFCPFFDEIKDILVKNILSLGEKQKTRIDSHVSAHLKINLKESNFNLHTQDNKTFNRLFEWIRYEIENYNLALSQTKLECSITESWYHITEYGGYHGTHTHSNCSWCAIFYVDPGEEGGWNIFQSRESVGHVDPGYFWWADMIKIQPEPGKLILFPSMLMHSAEPYLGKEKQRIVIACNTVTRLKENNYEIQYL